MNGDPLSQPEHGWSQHFSMTPYLHHEDEPPDNTHKPRAIRFRRLICAYAPWGRVVRAGELTTSLWLATGTKGIHGPRPLFIMLGSCSEHVHVLGPLGALLDALAALEVVDQSLRVLNPRVPVHTSAASRSIQASPHEHQFSTS